MKFLSQAQNLVDLKQKSSCLRKKYIPREGSDFLTRHPRHEY